ncbi:uncharacterized protein LOC130440597 [Diorhabda sublineata]|uniref:uncharacterized protein LOC130440597 n=1 Tax=Diorhabda sublineata TaxID=1163346 RepID=UPI0024E0DB76|nr:uncharacterized protein LOC130440597 [Diorhabda sublineata]
MGEQPSNKWINIEEKAPTPENIQRIIICYLLEFTSAIDEHRPKKSVEDRGKRNLERQVSHHYSSLPNYRLERRISSGPHYQNPQFYSRPYNKGRPQSYPIPPYAVQMEPLVHYSQRDPLYDTNILSLDPKNGDLLTENNQVQENIDRYGYHKPRVIERPVYIKEPEPIIEIIIKESNVSLPAPPTAPPPPKKKKEQVQVFYVKYQKNPHGSGKDSILYDKPVPAISPHIPDDEPEETPIPQYQQSVTAPPPPSTTLRTIIKPDSEVYHSPSGVKVTFGKEGFDYDKRSSKPEDYVPLRSAAPQGRQLTSFSNTYFKSPTSNSFPTVPHGLSSNLRQPQPYRTINLPSSYKPFGRQSGPSAPQQIPSFSFQNSQFGAQFSSFSQPTPSKFEHSVSHPAPARFQAPSKPNLPQNRQPVPYKPFDNLQPQQNLPQTSALHQPIQLRPETHFPIQQQLPLHEETRNFNSQRFNHLNSGEISARQPISQLQIPQQYQQLPKNLPQANFRLPQQDHLTQTFQQTRPDHQLNVYRPQKNIQPQINYQIKNPAPAATPSQFQHPQSNPPEHFHAPHQHNFFSQQNAPPQTSPFNIQRSPQQQQNFVTQSPHQQNEHVKDISAAQSILPPGGQLIPSVSKYETHISSIEPAPSQRLSPQQYQQKIIQQFNQDNLPQKETNRELLGSNELLTRQQSSGLPHNNQAFRTYQQSNSGQQNTIHQQYFSQQQNKNPQPNQNENYNQYFRNTQLAETSQPQQSSRNKDNQFNGRPEEQIRQFYQQSSDFGQGARGNTVSYSQSIGNEYRIGDVKTTSRNPYQSTTPTSTTTTTTPKPPSTTTKDPKILEAQLPDEVPDDLRKQLLSSGILNHADISVLDYDKVGDIPLSALPPDQLANFYGAGGAAQLSASDPVPSVVRQDGTTVEDHVEFEGDEPEMAASELVEKIVASPLVAEPSSLEMKVVRYDPSTDNGQQVQEKYVEEEADQVNPVVLNDNSYNRYLPLKINGTQFPIPDVQELKGKRISSVVVLAPISYDFSVNRKSRETTRELSKKSNDIDLIEGTSLKELLRNPSSDNFRKFLETENRTSSDKQAVILLVADSDSVDGQKEIFMYDVATQTVNKLDGELSSAFVEAAEANSDDSAEDFASSNIVETTVPLQLQKSGQSFSDFEMSARSNIESKVPIINISQDEDMETQASEQLGNFVDISAY